MSINTIQFGSCDLTIQVEILLVEVYLAGLASR